MNKILSTAVLMSAFFTFSNAAHSDQSVVSEVLSETSYVEIGETGVIGKWFDPIGPAEIAIQMNEQGEYFFHRRNADGSEGLYKLRKDSENVFHRDDKFGHMYRVEDEGLALLDNQGFIRMAALSVSE
ncbi:hypothetical protein ACGK9R_04400 [Halomonas sp. HNIBRBA4712]|uniref:hypothetical protein n=1 Tax=Halomonas sp. HNIBRBA4712 TaxID=3373087 RepID=UPI0037456DEE